MLISRVVFMTTDSDTSDACSAGAQLALGRNRWLDVDRGIVTATPKVHAAILEAISKHG